VDDEALKLLDTKREFTGVRNQVRLLYANDFETDSLPCPAPPIAGKNSLFVSADRPNSPLYAIPLPPGDARWLRAGAVFHGPKKEWEVWRMPQLVIRYAEGETVVQEDMIRIGRLLQYDGATRAIFLDSRLPRKNYDQIQVFFLNAGSSHPLLIDDFKVESFSDK